MLVKSTRGRRASQAFKETRRSKNIQFPAASWEQVVVSDLGNSRRCTERTLPLLHILTASRKGDCRSTRMGAQTSWRLLQQEEKYKDGGGERRACREGSARGQTDGTWAIKEKTVPFPKMKRS